MSAAPVRPQTAGPVPGERVPSGFGGILPHRLIRPRAPHWWQELLLIALGYSLYSLGRNAVPEQEIIAMRHGVSIQHLQDVLHLNFELSINHLVARTEWLAQIMNYYYATLHFVVTGAVMVWLYVAHPRVYRGARTVLFLTTIIGLAGFFLYPLAPPRLLPASYGYIDTLLTFHTWGSLADPAIAQHSNQYAAMPSLHIGWALWCGISLVRCARRAWVRALGAVYPLCTLLVIVGTANHYIFDAIGGALVLAAAFGLQWLLSGHGAFTPPGGTPEAAGTTPSAASARG